MRKRVVNLPEYGRKFTIINSEIYENSFTLRYMLRSQGNRLANYPESSLLILQLHKMLFRLILSLLVRIQLLCIYDFNLINLFNITGFFILDVVDFCPSV